MEKTKKRPPYASSGIADATLDLLRRTAPKKIDTKMIVDNKITTSTNAFTATDLLKWFGVIDEVGNVEEKLIQNFKLSGEEKEKFIKKMIEDAYSDLFEKVNLLEAKKDDVINYFVINHKFGLAQARYAAALFLHLCYKYNIPVAEELKKKTHTGTKKTKKSVDNQNNQKKENKTKSLNIPILDNISSESKVVSGEVLIEIRGASGLYFPFVLLPCRDF